MSLIASGAGMTVQGCGVGRDHDAIVAGLCFWKTYRMRCIEVRSEQTTMGSGHKSDDGGPALVVMAKLCSCLSAEEVADARTLHEEPDGAAPLNVCPHATLRYSIHV